VKITLKKTFLKDLMLVHEPQKSQVKTFLEQLRSNPAILTSIHLKQLRGPPGNFYRLRFGEYRLGYEKRTDEIILYRILPRQEIYRYFPPRVQGSQPPVVATQFHDTG
jgi:mRNA interferase RelE/StbE